MGGVEINSFVLSILNLRYLVDVLVDMLNKELDIHVWTQVRDLALEI